jgi:hypothetical protein
MDLADIAHRLQVSCQVGAAAGAENAPSVARQGSYRIAPEKP